MGASLRRGKASGLLDLGSIREERRLLVRRRAAAPIVAGGGGCRGQGQMGLYIAIRGEDKHCRE